MKRLYNLVACIIIVINAFAQDMSLPYSVYGIGDIDIREYNRLSGMGNTGLAIKSKGFIINKNPASLTGLDKSIFTIEASANGRFIKYTGTPINESNASNQEFSVEKVNLAMKLNSFWASNVGFKKFSTVNYQFKSTRTVDGSTKIYDALYDGDGGIYDFYWVNSFSIGKHLSVGVKTSLLSGSINQTETFSDEQNDYKIESKVQDYFSKAKMEFGLIYTKAFGKNAISLGAKYSPQTKLSAERTLTVTENSNTIVDDKFIKAERFTLPQSFGVGISIKSAKGILYALDYQAERWLPLKVRENGWSLVNSNRTSIGIEFPKTAKIYNTTYEKSFWQLGAFINNSYLSIRSKQVSGFGITAGFGGMLKHNLLYSISAEVGNRGTTAKNLIKENYVGFSFTISYREFVNSRGPRYD